MRIVILERDGVINKAREGLTKADHWVPIPGSLEAIARLNQAAYRVVIAFNLPGLADGSLSLEEATRIQHKLHRTLEQVGGQIDAAFFCPHAPQDNCPCRFPKSQMLKDIAARYHADLDELTLVGASRDSVEAATALGIRTLYIRNAESKRAKAGAEPQGFSASFDNLANAAAALISLDQIDY